MDKLVKTFLVLHATNGEEIYIDPGEISVLVAYKSVGNKAGSRVYLKGSDDSTVVKESVSEILSMFDGLRLVTL